MLIIFSGFLFFPPPSSPPHSFPPFLSSFLQQIQIYRVPLCSRRQSLHSDLFYYGFLRDWLNCLVTDRFPRILPFWRSAGPTSQALRVGASHQELCKVTRPWHQDGRWDEKFAGGFWYRFSHLSSHREGRIPFCPPDISCLDMMLRNKTADLWPWQQLGLERWQGDWSWLSGHWVHQS